MTKDPKEIQGFKDLMEILVPMALLVSKVSKDSLGQTVSREQMEALARMVSQGQQVLTDYQVRTEILGQMGLRDQLAILEELARLVRRASLVLKESKGRLANRDPRESLEIQEAPA